MKQLFLLAILILSNLGFSQIDTLNQPGNHDDAIPDLEGEKGISPNTDSEPFIFVQEMPQFLEGDKEKSEAAMMKYIIENIKYPQKAIKKNIEGIVRVKFTVLSTGELLNVHVINKEKLGYGCEEEAIRVIQSMPKWKVPGKQNGISVPVYYTIPVRFRLN